MGDVVATVLVLLVLLSVAALAARYGADSRSGGDVDLVAALLRRVDAYRRAWAALDRSLRPWESERPALARPEDA